MIIEWLKPNQKKITTFFYIFKIIVRKLQNDILMIVRWLLGDHKMAERWSWDD
jgi:hypothetical protein